MELKKAIILFARERAIRAWEIKASDQFPYESPSISNTTNAYFTYILELNRPSEALFKSFHKSMLQRAIKKAYRLGLSVKRCTNLKEVDQFYDLYLQMRRQRGLLPQPREFFKNVWITMSKEGKIDILFAEYQGVSVSTVFLLKYRDKVTYEYGATQTGAHRFSPSPFLLWEAILLAKKEGFSYFDFGRTASTEVTLSSFKRRWGATLHPFSYYDILNRSGSTEVRQNRILKALMGFSVRLVPQSACELAGRLLYKHLL